jgi:hypothetical protein
MKGEIMENTTLSRSIADLSNQKTTDVIGDLYSVNQLLESIMSQDIVIEDPFSREIVLDRRNLLPYQKLLEIFCRLGVFRSGQIAEIYTCLTNGDSLLPKNSPGSDTVGGIETKSTKSLLTTKCGRYFNYRIGNLENKDLSKVHVQITYGGMLQEAIIDLTGHTGNTLTIPADKDGIVKKNTTWGRFFA